MTWHYNSYESGGNVVMDVYDHTGEKVASEQPFNSVKDKIGQHGPYPSELLAIMRDEMGGSKPSAYNQALLADMASENIKEGTPY